jgi:hypothetical protein
LHVPTLPAWHGCCCSSDLVLRLRAFALLLSIVVAGSACGNAGVHVRRHTYPPDFDYLSAADVDAAMWRLAEQVRRLDAVLRDDARAEPDLQRAVVAILEQIEAETLLLVDDRSITNHPLLDRHVPSLRDDVALARDAAAATPPRYALAGAVSGACIYCHGARVAPAAEKDEP